MSFKMPTPAGGQPSPGFFAHTAQQAGADSFANANRRPFGSFMADGVPDFGSQPLPNNMFSTDDLTMMGYEDGHDHGDPKRRRIARACDMCRKKKIKCDGKMPACSHCQNYKTECVFTQVEKKRNPPKGAKYIEGLENRIGRFEALLRLSGLLTDDDSEAMDLQTLEKRLIEKRKTDRQKEKAGSSSRPSSPGDDSDETPSISRAASADPQKEPESGNPEKAPNGKSKSKEKEGDDEKVEAISEAMCSLVTNDCGETRYIGSSSGFSIFSPKGIQWVNEKTGDNSFQKMIGNTSMEDNRWVQWKPDVFGDIFQRRVYKPLPPKAEALSLLKDYFAHFNCMFPLFHEPTFMHLVEKHYSRDPYEGSGWWACLNVALAIAHRLRVMSNLVPVEEDQKAWGYLKNALAVQSDLTIRNTDLLSIQALLGMSLFLLGTPNPQPSFFLVAAAIRLAHSIGLHKKFSAYGLNPSEVEQRKRVFWIAYMLDKDICLRSGRPPIQDDDDMNIELPHEDPPDNIGNIPLADGKGKVNLFRLMCTFAVIASKVYKNLYSVKASKQSDGELLNTIGELDRELEDWKDAIPIDFRPEHEIKASHTPLILHVVVLHFAYYNCLSTIHRMSVHHGFWTSRLSNYAIQGLNVRPLNPRVFSSAALCVSSARASIHLIKYVPQGDFDCVWMILYYPVSALVTLFANILQNPQDSRARSDLKLMSTVVQFLSILCVDDSNSAVHKMLGVCSEFERISRIVIDKSDKDSHSRRKRKQVDTPASLPPPTPYAPSMMNSATSPLPQQPGNIPRVFSPPASAFLGADPRAGPHDGTSDVHWSPPAHGTSPLSTASTPHATIPDHASAYGLSPNGGGRTRENSIAQPPPQPQPHPHGQSGMSSAPGLMNGLYTATANGQPLQSNPFGMGAFGATEQLLMGNAFQHPFMPQDMWQMPMEMNWDWTDLSQSYAPSIDPAFAPNGVMNDMPPMPSNGENGR